MAIKDFYKDNPNVRIVGYVYETDDYEMFQKMEGNRDVEKFGRIKTSMKKNGFINCPILINEKGEVSDGQHRLASAEELKLPVKFVVQPGISLKETIDLNTGQKNWTAMNRVHGQAFNNENFARFEQLANIFSCTPQVIYTAMGVSITGGSVSGLIKNGSLICTEEQYEKAVITLKWATSFNDLIKTNRVKGSKPNFYVAIIFASRCKHVNIQTLSERIRANFHLYGTYFGSVEEIVKRTEDVYNFKVPMSNRVYIVDSYRKAAADSLARFKKRGAE